MFYLPHLKSHFAGPWHPQPLLYRSNSKRDFQSLQCNANVSESLPVHPATTLSWDTALMIKSRNIRNQKQLCDAFGSPVELGWKQRTASLQWNQRFQASHFPRQLLAGGEGKLSQGKGTKHLGFSSSQKHQENEQSDRKPAVTYDKCDSSMKTTRSRNWILKVF